jgi:hypothetical protein
MTSTEITEPDVDTDPETMSLEAVQAELREPSSASVESEEHRERRARFEVTETSYGRHPAYVPITRKCSGCGETVKRRVRTLQSWVDRPQFCSWECRWRYGRRIKRHKERTCVVCGASFTTTRRDAGYCSNACRQKAYRAAKPAAVAAPPASPKA